MAERATVFWWHALIAYKHQPHTSARVGKIQKQIDLKRPIGIFKRDKLVAFVNKVNGTFLLHPLDPMVSPFNKNKSWGARLWSALTCNLSKKVLNKSREYPMREVYYRGGNANEMHLVYELRMICHAGCVLMDFLDGTVTIGITQWGENYYLMGDILMTHDVFTYRNI